MDAAEPGGLPGLPHFAPKAKRVIYLFQSGAPSQMDLFDYKPRLKEFHGTELPDSVRMGQRLTGMTAAQSSFPVAPSIFKLQQHGQSGAWLSELLPHTARVADDSASSSRCTPRRSTTTRRSRFSRPARSWPAGPASAPGSPTAWGARTRICRRSSSWSRGATAGAQPLADRLWGSGFLPTQYQGVKFRSGGRSGALSVEPRGLHARCPAPLARRSGRS